MSDRAQPLSAQARRRGRMRGLVGLLYTSNPFYVLSADLVFVGLRMSFDTSGRSFETGALMLALTGYTLLLATTACLLIRLGKVWDDARTILLLMVAMFLAISVTFDEALAGNPMLGKACFVGGLIFAVLVSEGVLRGIRLRLPALYRTPYYLILSLFFLYPVALSPYLREPESPTLQWLLFGFSPIAGLVFLTLIPAIRRGPGYLAKNGSPWPYPLYPWTLFGLLAAAVCGRASYLCISLHFVEMSNFVGRSDSIFGPYFLMPFLLAMDLLLIEAAVVSRSRTMQRVAMAAIPGALLLAMADHRPNPVFQGFLRQFIETLGGSPFFFGLIAVAGLYGYASIRRVPMALGGLTAALLGLVVVGPDTLNLGNLVAPRPLPLLAVAVLELALAVRRRESWRALIAAICVIAAVTIGLEQSSLDGSSGFVAVHLMIIAAILIGASFHDALARILERSAALLLACSCLISCWGNREIFVHVPAELLRIYPPVIILLAAVYGRLSGRHHFVAAAVIGLAGWLTSGGWRFYRDLRRVVVGLDWITSGLAFFVVAAAISLVKTGLLGGWLAGRSELVDQRLREVD